MINECYKLKAVQLYPGVGLNAGIMLYNLTRMRTMVGGGFTEAIRFSFRKYGEQLKLIEQDILNIIFEKSPK